MQHPVRVFVMVILSVFIALGAWADFCEKCGGEMSSDTVFCKKCGPRVSGEEPAVAATKVSKAPEKAQEQAPEKVEEKADKEASTETAEERDSRLGAEEAQRQSIVLGNYSVSYSDSHTGKTFNACSKEWRVGEYNVDWNETQGWIGGLGEGWRNPTRTELKELYVAVGTTSEIGWDWVWAEKKESSSAWGVFFINGFENSSSLGCRHHSLRAVAVR